MTILPKSSKCSVVFIRLKSMVSAGSGVAESGDMVTTGTLLVLVVTGRVPAGVMSISTRCGGYGVGSGAGTCKVMAWRVALPSVLTAISPCRMSFSRPSSVALWATRKRYVVPGHNPLSEYGAVATCRLRMNHPKPVPISLKMS